MSKSILVIDTPKSCSECRIFNSDFYTCQLVFGELYEETKKGIRHENCPLKPLPERKYYSDGDDIRYVDGYEDCLDEILGEKE